MGVNLYCNRNILFILNPVTPCNNNDILLIKGGETDRYFDISNRQNQFLFGRPIMKQARDKTVKGKNLNQKYFFSKLLAVK